MTSPRAPALRIEIKIGDQCQLNFFRGDQPEPAIEVNNDQLSQAKLARLRDGIRSDFRKFRRNLGDASGIDRDTAFAALKMLHSQGKNLLYDLFGDQVKKKLPEAQDLCLKACPSLDERGWDDGAHPPPLIIVKGSVGYGIPLEILPLLSLQVRTSGGTLDDLGRLARSFIGFSAITKREIGTRLLPRTDLDNARGLPIRMFLNRDLEGGLREESYFARNPHIDFTAAWPEDGVRLPRSDFLNAFARHLWDCDIAPNGAVRNPPDQICHISCHCDTRPHLHPRDYALVLKDSNLFALGGRSASLDELTGRLIDLNLSPEGKEERSRPLIFLNACNSADLDPSCAGSFPDLFLKRDLGFVGFIGTEAAIPDGTASEFSEYFYERLLSGAPIGEALFSARWALLKWKNNPMGIFYTLYADPDISIRNPVSLPKRGSALAMSS